MSDKLESENTKYKLSNKDKEVIDEIKQAYKDIEQTRKSLHSRMVHFTVEQGITIERAKANFSKKQKSN